MGVGYFITLASWSWLIHIAFKEATKEGLLFVFVPLYAVYYIITRWNKTMAPVLVHLIGWIITLIPL